MAHPLGSFDLHIHSDASDGTLSPAQVMIQAAESGVKTLALTDHDTLKGLSEAKTTADRLGQRFINGVELTVNWRSRVLHLIGLGFDADDVSFDAYMQNLSDLRSDRAERIAQKLYKRGLGQDLLSLARTHAGEGQIGRPHFAQALIDLGKVGSMQEAFDQYLGQGRAGDVKADWPGFEEATALVKSCGGRIILAHPTKYKLTFTKLRALMADLIGVGADGLEVSYPGVSPGHLNELIRLADQQNCLVSAGSDFHSPMQRWTALGRYPAFNTDRLVLNTL